MHLSKQRFYTLASALPRAGFQTQHARGLSWAGTDGRVPPKINLLFAMIQVL